MLALLCRKSEVDMKRGPTVLLCVCVWRLVLMDRGLDNEDTQ